MTKAPKIPDDAAPMLGSMSQWQLIRMRFSRHKLASAAFFVIIILYLMAIFAQFLAPYPKNLKNMSRIYNPPMPVLFDFEHGFYTKIVQPHVHPVSYQKDYVHRRGEIMDLELFGVGHSYKMWGIIPARRHLLVAKNDPADLGTEREQFFYFLGADKFGRDMFSRVLAGAQISLFIGLMAIGISFTLGITIGCISGFFGGRVDLAIQRVIEIFQAIPKLPLWMGLAAAVPDDWTIIKTYLAITVILSFFGWTGMARVVRGKILSLREEDYAVAAKLLGASDGRIMFKHLLPGFTSHLIVTLTLSLPRMILGETSLSFLGIGLRPPAVSWGVMLQDAMNMESLRLYPWLLVPAFFIVFTILAFNFVGDGLRDAADPYSTG